MGKGVLRKILTARTRQADWPMLAWLGCVLLMAVVVLSWRSFALAQSDNVDQASSKSLTSYFKENRLPLVGAQVMKESNGQRRVVLYGFVATDEGKQDAERKALAYLGTPVPAIDDRLVIKPELATMTGPESPQPEESANYQSEGSTAPSGAITFDQLYQQIQQYGIKNPPGE